MRILLVEDEQGVSSFIKKGFEEQFYKVDAAFDGDIGLTLALQNEYDIILLDLIMPGLNGLELCKKVRERGISTPIIMLTALGATSNIVTGLDIGADDYITKPFKFKELLARVKAAARRKDPGSFTNELRIADLVVNLDTKEVQRNGQKITLTAKEFLLLEFLLKNKNRVLSRIDILENVWDISFDLGTNVVDVYVNYLRTKLDKPFKKKLIHTIIGMGYVIKES